MKLPEYYAGTNLEVLESRIRNDKRKPNWRF